MSKHTVSWLLAASTKVQNMGHSANAVDEAAALGRSGRSRLQTGTAHGDT